MFFRKIWLTESILGVVWVVLFSTIIFLLFILFFSSSLHLIFLLSVSFFLFLSFCYVYYVPSTIVDSGDKWRNITHGSFNQSTWEFRLSNKWVFWKSVMGVPREKYFSKQWCPCASIIISSWIPLIISRNIFNTNLSLMICLFPHCSVTSLSFSDLLSFWHVPLFSWLNGCQTFLEELTPPFFFYSSSFLSIILVPLAWVYQEAELVSTLIHSFIIHLFSKHLFRKHLVNKHLASI